MYEIKVIEMDDGVDGNLTYLGFELPASPEEIERVMSGVNLAKPYIAYSYTFRLESLNDRIIGMQSLNKLNSFATLLSGMSEYERIKLEGAILLTDCKTIEDCTRLMHNLDYFELTPNVDTYEALGRFLVADSFADPFENIPQDMMEYFDYDLFGRMGWQEETNIFVKGHHIRDTEKELREPGPGDPFACSLKMRLCSTDNPDGVWVKFPLAGTEAMDTPDHGDEMRVALHSLGVRSLSDCIVTECISSYPNLNRCIDHHADIPLSELLWKAQNFGFAESEIGQYGMDAYAKFAAVMEYEDCTSLDFAVDITQNLDCYEYAPDIENYAQKYLKGKKVDATLIACFNLRALGYTLMAQHDALATKIGIVSRNDHEFSYDYSQPRHEDQEQGGITFQ